jgi:hypothetical protein
MNGPNPSSARPARSTFLALQKRFQSGRRAFTIQFAVSPFLARHFARDAHEIYFACSCASNITLRVPSSNSPVVDFGFRSDPSMGASVSVGGLYATVTGGCNADVSSVSSISSAFRTIPVDRSWMRRFRLSIFLGFGGGV